MNKLVQCLLFGFTAVSGFWLAKVLWLLIFPVQSVELAVQVEPKSAINFSVNTQLDGSINNARLFGEYAAPKVAVKSPVRATPTPKPTPKKTNLPKLNFEITTPLAGIGAILSPAPRGKQQYFKIGQEVFGKGKLVKVTNNSVFIDRGAQTDEIIFDKNKVGKGGPITAVKVDNRMAGSNIDDINPVVPKPTRDMAAVMSRGNGRGSMIRNNTKSKPTPVKQTKANELPRTVNAMERMANTIVSSAKQNPNSLLQQYGLQATSSGYRVTSSATLIMLAGLRPGDLIVEVNDIAVGNPAADARRIEQVVAGKDVKIEFIRGGSRTTLYIKLPF